MMQRTTEPVKGLYAAKRGGRIAVVLHVHTNTINAGKARDLDFPTPIRRLRGIDLWDLREVLEWATRTGRYPPSDL